MNLIRKYVILFDEQKQKLQAITEFNSLNQFQSKELGIQVRKLNAQQSHFTQFSFFTEYTEYLNLLNQHFKKSNELFQKISPLVQSKFDVLYQVIKKIKSAVREAKQFDKKKYYLLYKILLDDLPKLLQDQKEIRNTVQQFAFLDDKKKALKSIFKTVANYFKNQIENYEQELTQTVKKMHDSIYVSDSVKFDDQPKFDQQVSQNSFFSSNRSNSNQVEKLDFKDDQTSQDLLSEDNEDLISMTQILNQQSMLQSENSIKIKQEQSKQRFMPGRLSIQTDRLGHTQSYKNIQAIKGEYGDQNFNHRNTQKGKKHKLKFLALSKNRNHSNSNLSVYSQKQRQKKHQHLQIDGDKDQCYFPFKTANNNSNLDFE